MSSNVLTDNQPVESIKKFKFYTRGDKEEIEIVIPEVNDPIFISEAFHCNKYGVKTDAFIRNV